MALTAAQPSDLVVQVRGAVVAFGGLRALQQDHAVQRDSR
jgi:hypothetical protein